MRRSMLPRIAAMLIAWLCGTALTPADDTAHASTPVPEYRLKCMFLYNFGRFVKWPKAARGPSKRPFTIGVIQKKPLADGLAAIEGKKLNGRPIRILSCETLEDMRECHIVFLNSEDDLWIKHTLQSLSKDPILTVGEAKGFTRWGGMINLRLEGQKLKLDINPRAADEAGLKISSQLLGLARIVEKEAR